MQPAEGSHTIMKLGGAFAFAPGAIACSGLQPRANISESNMLTGLIRTVGDRSVNRFLIISPGISVGVFSKPLLTGRERPARIGRQLFVNIATFEKVCSLPSDVGSLSRKEKSARWRGIAANSILGRESPRDFRRTNLELSSSSLRLVRRRQNAVSLGILESDQIVAIVRLECFSTPISRLRVRRWSAC